MGKPAGLVLLKQLNKDLYGARGSCSALDFNVTCKTVALRSWLHATARFCAARCCVVFTTGIAGMWCRHRHAHQAGQTICYPPGSNSVTHRKHRINFAGCHAADKVACRLVHVDQTCNQGL